MAKSQPVEVPGAPVADPVAEAAAVNEAASAAEAGQAALIERLLAENAALKASAAPSADTPSVVFTPETPHGRAALAASPFRDMTAAEVTEGLLNGTIPQPVTSYLTRDGYVCRTAVATPR